MLPLLQQPTHAVWRAGWLIPLVLATALQSAYAEGVTATLSVRTLAPQADGRVAAKDVDRSRPGDLLEYRVVYRNTAKGTARRVEATLPIPPGTHYEVNGAGEMAPLASIDGQRFEPTPLTHRVTLPNGQTQHRPVPLSDYRQLRWPLGDLATGQTATVVATARVVSIKGSKP